jgi:hypothetical protein
VVGLGRKEAIVKKSPVQNRAFSLFEDFSFFFSLQKRESSKPYFEIKRRGTLGSIGPPAFLLDEFWILYPRNRLRYMAD